MRKLVAIYERKGVLFVAASHRTKAGFWIDDDQVVKLTAPTPDELGRAVESALARSQEEVLTPPPNAQIDRPLLEAASVGSWATFMKLSKHVRISNDDGMMKLTPYRNLGSKEGFEPQSSQSLQPQPASSALGQIVIEALSRAR